MCGFQGLPVPERSRRDWLFAAALFATAIVWHLPQFSFVQMNPDEGIVLQGAHRILHGAVLYRDFFSFYTPGSYYWTAVLFRMLGESILTARAALLLYAGLTAALAYLLARRLCSRTASVVVSIALIMAWSFRFLALHNWDSTMLSLAALYAAVWLLQAQRGYWAAVTGLLAGLTLLTEQSKGAGLLLGLAIALLLIPRLTGSSLRRLHVLMLIAGFLAPVLLTFAYFAAKRSVWPMVSAWVWPLQHYSIANRLPYGASILLSDVASEPRAGAGAAYWTTLLAVNATAILIAAAPAIVVLFAAFRGYFMWWRGQSTPEDRYFLFFGITTAGLLTSTFATGRADLPHTLYLAPLCWFLLPAALAGADLNHLRAYAPAVAAVALAGLTIFSLVMEWPSLAARDKVSTRRGIIRTQVADEALLYIQRNLPPRSKLLVHPYNPLYSFLTDTENPTRYEYLQPGMNTRDQFAEVRRDLASHHAAVLLDLGFLSKVPSNWPSTPATSIAQDLVTDYILMNYRPCAILNPGSRNGGAFVYMTYEGTTCPGR